MIKTFSRLGRARIAIEVGTHSPWVAGLLQSLGNEVILANPRQVKLATPSNTNTGAPRRGLEAVQVRVLELAAA